MEITEVRIKLMDEPNDRLQAFCSITFDNAFVVRDLKIIEGNKGPFVAMPSRKLTDRCPRCNAKNHLRAQNCNQCGHRLSGDRAARDGDGRAKLHADIAHPINSTAREMIQRRVLEAYREELARAQQPGYVSRYDDAYDDFDDTEWFEAAPTTPRMPQDVISRVENGDDLPGQGPHHRPQEQPSETRDDDASVDRFGEGIL